ncbi:MAG: hypothetical protein L3K01_00110 [Thermoplasmata archaeon]|nr:hypothetical protein [Thermoplasmata archaeon]
MGIGILLGVAAGMLIAGGYLHGLRSGERAAATVLSLGVVTVCLAAVLALGNLVVRGAFESGRAGLDPLFIEVSTRTIRVQYQPATEEAYQWTDPNLIVTVTDGSFARIRGRSSSASVLRIERLPWKEGQVPLLALLIPEGTADWLVGLANELHLSVDRGKFAVGGKGKVVILETQMHNGPPVETESPRFALVRGKVRVRD